MENQHVLRASSFPSYIGTHLNYITIRNGHFGGLEPCRHYSNRSLFNSLLSQYIYFPINEFSLHMILTTKVPYKVGSHLKSRIPNFDCSRFKFPNSIFHKAKWENFQKPIRLPFEKFNCIKNNFFEPPHICAGMLYILYVHQ